MIIKTERYLSLSNDLIKSYNTMKPMENLLFLLICQHMQSNINSQIKTNMRTIDCIESDISISRKYLSKYFTRDQLGEKRFNEMLNGVFEKQNITSLDGMDICDLIDDCSYDGNNLWVCFNLDEFCKFFIDINSHTQIDLHTMFKYCRKSKNTINLLMLIFRFKSTGLINIGEDDLRFCFGRSDRETKYFREDIKRTIKSISGFIDLKFKVSDSGSYIFEFKKFNIKQIKIGENNE